MASEEMPRVSRTFGKMMKCIRSGEQMKIENDSSESLATRDYSMSNFSSLVGEPDPKVDNTNIEEAESSLRESGFLNYEEARALLGRLEYQKGNYQAALHVFDGIDITNIASKMKASLSKKQESNRRQSSSDASPPMSLHAVSLLLEAILLKAKSLQRLQRFKEAANSCKVILDTVESALPEGIPEGLYSECKLQEVVNKAVELLPELWQLDGNPQNTIASYRRGLLYNWNLESEVKTKLSKDFAVFLLYSGAETSLPNFGFQTEGSFVPRNNVEEAVLLLLLLLKNSVSKGETYDPSIIAHLTFAIAVSGGLKSLAHVVEGLLPFVMDMREKCLILALCYYTEGDGTAAASILRNVPKTDGDLSSELFLAARICADGVGSFEEGIGYLGRAISSAKCAQMGSSLHCLLGVLLHCECKAISSDSKRTAKQMETLRALKTAEDLMVDEDPNVVYQLAVANADQRKLEVALSYAKRVIRLDGGTKVRSFVLLGRILSAQKRLWDAENVINAALEQTGKWEQGELLRTKAKLQCAQKNHKGAVETYTHLLAVLQIRNKSSKVEVNECRDLEMETWHDLANVYTNLSQWRDAEICLLKSSAINPYSASKWHSTGLLKEAKGLYEEALQAFKVALDIDPLHVGSLVATACVLRRVGSETKPVIRSFLTDALKVDRTNHSAWYNLGLLHVADDYASASEAVECFEAANFLEETAPIEPF